MTRFYSFMLLLLLLWIFPGCLDMVEEVTLKQDGSGSYRMQVDLASLIKSEMGDAGETTAFADNLLKGKGWSLDSLRSSLDKQKGIRNSYFHAEGFVFSWGYDFEHIDFIKGNQEFQSLGDKPGAGPARYALERADKKHYWFVRRHVPHDLNEWTGANPLVELGSFFFKEGSYTLIYHLPSRIKEVNQAAAMVSDRKRTVSMTVALNELMKDPTVGDLRMKFKRKPKYREPW